VKEWAILSTLGTLSKKPEKGKGRSKGEKEKKRIRGVRRYRREEAPKKGKFIARLCHLAERGVGQKKKKEARKRT